MKVIVIGAGMGGTCAAIALSRIGIDVAIYERVREIKPVGAAISVWSNGVKCLNHLGLQEQVKQLGGIVDSMAYVDGHTGETMCDFSLAPLIEQVGQRPYPVARTDLQLMLMENFGTDRIHLGHKVTSVSSEIDSATITFEDGSSATADLVIAADGANSLAREYVLGSPVTRRYSGYVNFNGLVPLDPEIGPSDRWTTYVADGKRVSVMPVAGERFYFFFDVVEPMGADYDRNTAREVLSHHFAGWAPGVQKLIAALDPQTTNRVEILDLDPFDTWVRGRVALLGDAAHNTTPDIGQGGCSAMEDAVALQFAFQDHRDDIDAALRAYQDSRTERAAELVLAARRRCDLTHAKDPALTAQWYDDLRSEDGSNIIRGIAGNIMGGPLT